MHTPLSDQLANISALWVVWIVSALTVIRVALARNRRSWAQTVRENCSFLIPLLLLFFLLWRPFVAQAFYIPTGSMKPTLLENDKIMADKFSYRLHGPQRGDVVVFNAPPEATETPGEEVLFVKRLIGLPGDTIEVRPARLRVAGRDVDTYTDGFASVHNYLRSVLQLQDADSLKIFPDHVLVDGTRRIGKTEIARALGRPGAAIVLTPGETLRNGAIINEPYTREDPDYSYGPRRLGDGELFMMGDNRNQSLDSHFWGPLDSRRVVGRARFTFWPFRRAGSL